MNLISRILTRARDHIELLLVGFLLLALFVAFRSLPQIDPRIGFDGWSDILYALLGAGKLLLMAYGAWWCKTLYHGDTPNSLMWADKGDSDAELLAIVIDRAEYGFWVTVWFLGLFVF